MTDHPGTPAESGDYFYTPALKGLVQQLSHLAFFGDGISVVLGSRGSGKTALSHELVKEFMAAHSVARIALDSDLELLDCIEEVSLALGLVSSSNETDSGSVGEMLAELRHYVQALAQDKKLVVLIIDDAHHLDDQAIGALISLLQGHGEANSGLHLVLLSESGLEQRIDSLQIVDVALYDFEIPNFSPTELASFLEQRGDLGDSLNSSKLQKIWAAARGYPGLALRNLIGSVGESSEGRPAKVSLIDKVRKNLPFAHIAAVGILIAVLLASFFLGGGDDDKATGKRKIVALPQLTPAPVVSPSLDSKSDSDEEVNTGLGVAAGGLIDRNSNPVPNNVDVENGNSRVLNQSTNTASPAPSPTPFATRSADAVDLSAQPTKTTPRPQPVATPLPVSKPTVTPAPLSSPSVNRIVEPGAPKVLNDDEVFLMSQNADFFTLQVIAASKRASLESYISRQPNRASLKLYRGTREGKTWFVVVQGVYSTRALALNALKSLPEEQAKAGPWPRKFSSIQEEIETFRRN